MTNESFVRVQIVNRICTYIIACTWTYDFHAFHASNVLSLYVTSDDFQSRLIAFKSLVVLFEIASVSFSIE